ncbi:hypothetical protein [Nostoc linckia]|nr:hypothetical protein [Nostoc linckia]
MIEAEAGTGRHGDAGTRGRGDAGKWGRGDTETRGLRLDANWTYAKTL